MLPGPGCGRYPRGVTDTRRASRVLAPGDRSALPDRRGIPWWAGVVVALVLAGVGAGIDLSRGTALTAVFTVLYVLGCVAAVLAVTRRGLFAAAVQPPLVLVVVVPVLAWVTGRSGSGGLRGAAIAVALPLVNAFPVMAFTTVAVVVLAVVRVLVHRRSDPGAGPGAGPSPTGVDPEVVGAAAPAPTRAAPARPDTARPDTARPDTARPDTARPDTARLDTARPDPRPAAGGADLPGARPAPRRAAPRRAAPSDEHRTERMARPEPRRYGPSSSDPVARPVRPRARADDDVRAPRRPGTRLPPLPATPPPARPVRAPRSSGPRTPPPSSNDRYWQREQ